MNPKLRTFQYTIINVAYFAAYAGVHAYATVFLLDRGFSNTVIGIILALANILSVLMQPMAAGWIDKYEKFTNRKVAIACAAGCMLGCILLYFVKGMAVIFIIYVLLYTLQMVYQPLNQAICFEYNAIGDKINFGLARGLGSCGFAITSFFIGKLLANNGVSVLQIVNVLAFIVGIFMMFIFTAPKNANSQTSNDAEVNEVASEAHNSFISFVKYYPVFMLFVLAGTCLFFEHNAINDYLIQVIVPLGGDSAKMGQMVMVAAFLELPAMAGFPFLEKKFGVKKILMFSAIMFTVKTALMLFATNLYMIYASQACQMCAYALFIPGGAYLAERVMEQADKTKGQAYINCCITLGGVFSALVCGRILDVLGVHSMLLVSTIIGIIGSVIAVIAVSRMKETN